MIFAQNNRLSQKDRERLDGGNQPERFVLGDQNLFRRSGNVGQGIAGIERRTAPGIKVIDKDNGVGSMLFQPGITDISDYGQEPGSRTAFGKCLD